MLDVIRAATRKPSMIREAGSIELSDAGSSWLVALTHPLYRNGEQYIRNALKSGTFTLQRGSGRTRVVRIVDAEVHRIRIARTEVEGENRVVEANTREVRDQQLDRSPGLELGDDLSRHGLLLSAWARESRLHRGLCLPRELMQRPKPRDDDALGHP